MSKRRSYEAVLPCRCRRRIRWLLVGTEIERIRVPGIIAGFSAEDPHVRVDQQGRTVSIELVTYGSGCYRKGDSEVAVEGLQANVRPYDYAPPPGTPCTRDLVSFAHTAVVEFEGKGIAHIYIHGLTTEDDPQGEPITVELTVPIQ